MTFFVPLLLLATTLYIGIALLFVIGLYRLDKQPQTTDQPFISVVIAARNEAEYIGTCLESLNAQTYPADKFEIIVVDDDSSDNTAQIVAASTIANLKLLVTGTAFPHMAAKKRPLSVGIAQARGQWILTTDADCQMPSTWIAQMAAYMTADTGIVIGFSQLKTAQTRLTLFQRLQAFDFLALMSAAAGACGLGYPLAASGQNFAYRKALFDRIGGFQNIAHRPSGDDVLLLQLLRKTWQGRTAFANHPAAHTHTRRSETPSSFWQQRIRWASNAAYQLRINFLFFIYIAIVFCTNALICIGILTPATASLTLTCWLLKTLADQLITGRGARLFGRTDLLAMLPLWEFLQAPYTVLIGLTGTFGSFTWKDRRHK